MALNCFKLFALVTRYQIHLILKTRSTEKSCQLKFSSTKRYTNRPLTIILPQWKSSRYRQRRSVQVQGSSPTRSSSRLTSLNIHHRRTRITRRLGKSISAIDETLSLGIYTLQCTFKREYTLLSAPRARVSLALSFSRGERNESLREINAEGRRKFSESHIAAVVITVIRGLMTLRLLRCCREFCNCCTRRY